jgi:aspartate/methionine/tyrosine aminotransferase
MKLRPFLLDQWLGQHGDPPIEFNLGGSAGPPWTFRDLLRLDGETSVERLLDAQAVYGLSPGGRSLRQVIAAMRQVPAEHVLVVGGGSEALLHVFFRAAAPGANVVVPDPGFPPYHALPEALGLEVRGYRLGRETGYRVDLDEITRLTDARTALVLVNSPHNPSGAVIADAELDALHAFIAGRGIQLVCDEVFHPIYHGPEAGSAARLPHATVIGDCSKALALAGLRVGWLIEPDRHRREDYLNAREYVSISNTIAGELFAEIAVRHRDAVLGRTRTAATANLRRLDRLMAEQADVLDWVRPRGGMVAFPRFRSGADARPFCEAAAARGVLVTPGDCFGVPDHFRAGFGGDPERFAPALERLAESLRAWALRPVTASAVR